MILMYASEAREDFDRRRSPLYHPRDHWFFLLQSFLAVSHLSDCQHCDVETISYAGEINNKRVWMGRA